MRANRLILAFAAALTVAHAAEPDLRLGVWSEPSQRDTAALVETKLSTLPGIRMLERDELDKIVSEQQLSEAFAKGSAAIKRQLTGVDALLFLTPEDEALRVRFVSVKHGLVLADLLLPKANASEQADAIFKRIPDLLAKVRAPSADSLAISILNLHNIMSGDAARKTAAALTTLLESRLSAEPQVFVLDRRTMDDLQLEKALDGDKSPFHAGVWLIEGNIEPDPKDATSLHLSLSLRRQDAKSNASAVASGKAADLPALVEEATRKLLAAAHSHATQAAWDPAAEGREFGEEAVWAWRRNMPDRALAAIASARALGFDAPDLIAIHIDIVTYRLGTEDRRMDADDMEAPKEDLSKRVPAATEVLREYWAYRQSGKVNEFLWIDANQELDARGNKLHLHSLQAGLSILEEAVAAKGYDAAPELREQLRIVLDYDPTAQRGDVDWWGFSHDYDTCLALDAEEFMAFQLNILKSTDPDQRKYAARTQSRLQKAQAKIIPGRMEPNASRRAALFKDFMTQLKADPKLRHAAIFIESGTTTDPAEKLRYARLYFDEILAHLDDLEKAGWLNNLVYSTATFDPEILKQLAPERARFAEYFIANTPDNEQLNIYAFRNVWKPETFPKESAPAIWRAFTAYRDRSLAAADEGNRENVSGRLETADRDFAKVFPDIVGVKPPAPPPPTLEVTRFWDSAQGKKWIIFNDICAVGHHVAIHATGFREDYKNSVLLVSLPDMKTQLLQPGGQIVDFALTDRACFVISKSSDQPQCNVTRYDLDTGKSETHVLPLLGGQFNHAFGETLYLNGSGMSDHSLLRHDWKKNLTTVLVSSSRKPAISPFDNNASYENNTLFAGPGGVPCQTVLRQIYEIKEGPGAWPQLAPAPTDPEKQGWIGWTLMNRGEWTLLTSNAGDALLIDPAGDKPIKLRVSDRLAKISPEWAEGVKPRPFPPDIAKDAYTAMHHRDAGQRGIFDLKRTAPEDGGYLLLRWYPADGPGEGYAMRLEFALPPSTPNFSSKKRFSELFDPKEGLPKIDVCDDGLVFATNYRGFWFLPYADLDAFRKAQDSHTAAR